MEKEVGLDVHIVIVHYSVVSMDNRSGQLLLLKQGSRTLALSKIDDPCSASLCAEFYTLRLLRSQFTDSIDTTYLFSSSSTQVDSYQSISWSDFM